MIIDDLLEKKCGNQESILTSLTALLKAFGLNVLCTNLFAFEYVIIISLLMSRLITSDILYNNLNFIVQITKR